METPRSVQEEMTDEDSLYAKAHLAKCKDCPLLDCEPVYGFGPEQADLVIVGEAPGLNETKKGRPFVGKSGQLLDKALVDNGVVIKEAYYTNACLCRPPGNETPSAKAIKACRDRLIHEIQGRSPKQILCVGAIAAKSVLGTTDGITSLREKSEHISPELGVKVIPTFHTAAALRDPGKFPAIVRDIKQLGYSGDYLRQTGWEHTKYKVIHDTDTAIRVLAKQAEYPELVVDVERHYDSKEIDNRKPNLLCLGISHRPGASVVYDEKVFNDPRFQQVLAQLYARKDINWAWQNGKFDIQWQWHFAPEARVDDDTMLMHYATDEREKKNGGGHGLELIASIILNAPRYKTETRKWLPYEGAPLSLLPPHILWEYNATDADVTHRILEPLRKEMKSDGVDGMYHRLLIPGSNVLAGVEHRGIALDIPGLEQLAEVFSREMAEGESALKQWVSNPRSHVQIRAALQDLGYWVPNTQKDTIKDIPEEFVEKLLEYKSIHKLASTYVKAWLKRQVNGRLHANFNLHTTETGRLSSSAPNLQNIPIGRTMRDMLIAGEGRTFITADYSAIELRLMALLCNDPYMLQAFREGRNLHRERALKLFGDNYTDRQYVSTKSVAFGSIFGETAKHLAERLGITIQEAKKIQLDIFVKSPTIKRYWAETEEQILENGHLRSIFGRVRRFWLVTADNWYDIKKEGYNFRVQSPASDLTLESLIKLTPLLEPYDAHPVLLVHDSNTFDCPVEATRDVARLIKEVMEDTGLDVPTPVEIKVGPRWGSGELYEV